MALEVAARAAQVRRHPSRENDSHAVRQHSVPERASIKGWTNISFCLTKVLFGGKSVDPSEVRRMKLPVG